VNQSQLPPKFEERIVASLPEGQTAYTLPWFAWADGDRMMWIAARAPIVEAPTQEATMRIKRAIGSIWVDTRTIKPGDRWRPGKLPPMYREGDPKLPVVFKPKF
jgi:hypothetical protein